LRDGYRYAHPRSTSPGQHRGWPGELDLFSPPKSERSLPTSEWSLVMSVTDAIRHRLTAALAPVRLDLVDESARHAGHAGARPQGESHFRLTIVAAAFAGRSRIERQRLVFAALGDLMESDIHALAITALAPAEAEGRR
jgi:BolA family transcriptional regulator, general stress-responsive regulator